MGYYRFHDVLCNHNMIPFVLSGFGFLRCCDEAHVPICFFGNLCVFEGTTNL